MEKQTLQVVAAAIVDQGKVLAGRRGPGKIAETSHRLEFPGGKREPGESEREALVRELAEELSVTVRVGRKLMQTRHEYSAAAVELSVYLCTLESGVPVSAEHEELIWLDPADLDPSDWAPADGPALELLRREFAGRSAR